MTPIKIISSTFLRLASSQHQNFLLHTRPLHPSYLQASRVLGMVRIFEEASNKVSSPFFPLVAPSRFTPTSIKVSELRQKFENPPEADKPKSDSRFTPASQEKVSELRRKFENPPEADKPKPNSEKFEEKLNEIADIFKNHPAINHQLFSYLKDQSDTGFNKLQYAIFYSNFLFRTKETIPSVALALARAVREGDFSSTALHADNLADETGHGNPDHVHLQLLMNTFNEHGKRIFDLDPISIQDLKESILITLEVKEYCEMKVKIFLGSYAKINGNMWAHEYAADDMLKIFREAFFEPYKSHYTEDEYKELMKFFDAHRDDSVDGGDVEAEHQRMARQAVYFSCKDDIKKLDAVLEGGLMMLDCQARVWDSILRETKKYEKWMEKVPPINTQAQVKESRLIADSVLANPSSSVNSAKVISSRQDTRILP
jgi:hypothetical protein